MTRRIFLDTEWTGPPWSKRSELIWIGLADEGGRSWYGISSEVDIDPSANDFISGVFRLITPDEPRLTNKGIAAAVIDFCGDVDEFWAWIPTMESFSEWSGLGKKPGSCTPSTGTWIFRWFNSSCSRWPDRLLDLNAATVEARGRGSPRTVNHLHPRVHAEWNRELFERLIRTSRESGS